MTPREGRWRGDVHLLAYTLTYPWGWWTPQNFGLCVGPCAKNGYLSHPACSHLRAFILATLTMPFSWCWAQKRALLPGTPNEGLMRQFACLQVGLRVGEAVRVKFTLWAAGHTQ